MSCCLVWCGLATSVLLGVYQARPSTALVRCTANGCWPKGLALVCGLTRVCHTIPRRYPRIFGVDVKRFVNCRFSMTFWMLAGISFLAADTLKTAAAGSAGWDDINAALFFSALSQFIYLAKFFKWEIGYMR